MTDEGGQDQRVQRARFPEGKPAGPLWIIAALLGLCELAMITVVTLGSGWIQAMFAIFAVMYPLLLTGLFFFVLIRHTAVLYAPKDYAGGTTFTEFAGVFAHTQQLVTAKRERATLEVFRESVASVTDSASIADAVIERTQLAIASRALHVEGETPAPSFYVDAPVDASVQDLLDIIWLDHINRFVPPFSYGDRWLLTQGQRPVVQSDEALESAGILPGASLRLQILPDVP